MEEVNWRSPCERHKQESIDFLAQLGLTSNRDIERIRHELDALVRKTYSIAFLDHLARGDCMHCCFERSSPRCYAWVWEAMRALAKDEPTPLPVVKQWVD